MERMHLSLITVCDVAIDFDLMASAIDFDLKDSANDIDLELMLKLRRKQF